MTMFGGLAALAFCAGAAVAAPVAGDGPRMPSDQTLTVRTIATLTARLTLTPVTGSVSLLGIDDL